MATTQVGRPARERPFRSDFNRWLAGLGAETETGLMKAIEIAPWERRWRWPSTYVDGILATTQVGRPVRERLFSPDFNRWLVGLEAEMVRR